MIIGILKEIKSKENRVTMTPAGAEVMKQNGHVVLVEKAARCGSGFENDAYLIPAHKLSSLRKKFT